MKRAVGFQVPQFLRMLPVPSTDLAAGGENKQAALAQAARAKVLGWGLPAHGHSGLTALLLLLWSKYEIPVQTQPPHSQSCLCITFHILAYGT